MKLLAIIGWGSLIFPILFITCKLIGWIKLSWWITISIAIGIPAVVCAMLFILAIWVITKTFNEEWEQQ